MRYSQFLACSGSTQKLLSCRASFLVSVLGVRRIKPVCSFLGSLPPECGAHTRRERGKPLKDQNGQSVSKHRPSKHRPSKHRSRSRPGGGLTKTDLQQAAGTFARQLLCERLKAVRKWQSAVKKLPKISKKLRKASGKDPEGFSSKWNDPALVAAVHQVRVSSRRAVAAIEVFGPFAPPRRASRLQKQLKQLRRAAGAARDLDVLRERWQRSPPEVPNDPQQWTHFWACWSLARYEAHQSFRRGSRRFREKHPLSAFKLFTQKIRWRDTGYPEPTLAQFAVDSLVPLVGGFLAAQPDQSVLDPLEDLEQWHRLRIAGKQLRYALELFGPALQERYHQEVEPLFQDFQDTLGMLNDHATAEARLRGWQTSSRKRLQKIDQDWLGELIAWERKGQRSARDHLKSWWETNAPALLENLFVICPQTLSSPSPESLPG